MEEGKRMYWKSFISSTKNKAIAEKFGKYTYTIFLSARLSHEYIIIPEHLSKYNEEEVLIFPYLYFEVTKNKIMPINKTRQY